MNNQNLKIGETLGSNAISLDDYNITLRTESLAILNSKNALAINSSSIEDGNGGVGKTYLVYEVFKYYENNKNAVLVNPIDCYAPENQTRWGILKKLYTGLKVYGMERIKVLEDNKLREYQYPENLGDKIEDDFITNFYKAFKGKNVYLFFDSFEYFYKSEKFVFKGIEDVIKHSESKLSTRRWLLDFIEKLRVKLENTLYVTYAGRNIIEKDTHVNSFLGFFVELADFKEKVGKDFLEIKFKGKNAITEDHDIKDYTENFNPLWCSIFAEVIKHILQGNDWSTIKQDYLNTKKVYDHEKNISEEFKFKHYLCIRFSFLDKAWGYDIHRTILVMATAAKGVDAKLLSELAGMPMTDAKQSIERLQSKSFVKILDTVGEEIRLHDDFAGILKVFLKNDKLQKSITDSANFTEGYGSYGESLRKLLEILFLKANCEELQRKYRREAMEYIVEGFEVNLFDETEANKYFNHIEYEFFKAIDNSASDTRRIVRICKHIVYSDKINNIHYKIKTKALLLVAEFFIYHLPDTKLLGKTIEAANSFAGASQRLIARTEMYQAAELTLHNKMTEALTGFQKAYTKLLQCGQDHWAARCALWIGFCHQRLGNFKEGDKWAKKSVRDSLFFAEGITEYHDAYAHTQRLILDKSRLKAISNLSYINQRTGKIIIALNYAEQCAYEWENQSMREHARSMINVIYCKIILNMDVTREMENLVDQDINFDMGISNRISYLKALLSYKSEDVPSNFSRYLTKDALEERLGSVVEANLNKANKYLESILEKKIETRESAEAYYLRAKIDLCLKKYDICKDNICLGLKLCEKIEYEYLKEEFEDLQDFVDYIFANKFDLEKYKKIHAQILVTYADTNKESTISKYKDILVKKMLLYGNYLYNINDKKSALSAYLTALLCSTDFSQHRYAQTLSSLPQKAFEISADALKGLSEYKLLLEHKPILFGVKGGDFLAKVIIKRNLTDDDINDYREKCKDYMAKGHYVKALTLDIVIIDYYTKKYKGKDKAEKLVFQYFTHIYAHQMAGDVAFVKKFIREAKDVAGTNDTLLAVVGVAEAISKYRTNTTTWIESYLYGDEMKYDEKWKPDEDDIVKDFKKAQSALINQDDSRYKKVLAEAYFRLGEYYLLRKYKDNALEQLSKCVDLSQELKDALRERDAIESIHNVYYLLDGGVDPYNQLDDEKYQEQKTSFVKLSENYVSYRDKYREEQTDVDPKEKNLTKSLKVVIAKLLMTRGDAIFTEFNKPNTESDKYFDSSNDTHRYRLSKMMYYYCFAAELFHRREVGSWSFAYYVRELRKRFDKIVHGEMASMMAAIFLPQWKQYEDFTKDDLRKDEGKMLLQTLKAKVITLKEKKAHEQDHTKN